MDAISIDSTVPPAWAAERLQPRCTVQGNLDPAALLAGGEALHRAASSILDALGHGPFVFNLGEGVVPSRPRRSTWQNSRTSCGPGLAKAHDEPRCGGPVQPGRTRHSRCRRALPAQPLPGSGNHPRAGARAPPYRSLDRAASRPESAGTFIKKSAAARRCLPRPRRRRLPLARTLDDLGEVEVAVAMRYWHPMSAAAARQVAAFQPDRVVLLPLYPQFSTTTTASSLAAWRAATEAAGIAAPTTAICCYPCADGTGGGACAADRTRAGGCGRSR